MLYREGIIAFLGIKDEEGRRGRSWQKVGEYCKGRDVEECRTYWGERLAENCATCPD